MSVHTLLVRLLLSALGLDTRALWARFTIAPLQAVSSFRHMLWMIGPVTGHSCSDVSMSHPVRLSLSWVINGLVGQFLLCLIRPRETGCPLVGANPQYWLSLHPLTPLSW